MTMAIRFADPLAPTPYEVRHPRTGEIRAVGEFELLQIGDCDVAALKDEARTNPGQWVQFHVYKPRTYRAYR